MNNQHTTIEPLRASRARATSPPELLVDELVRRLRGIATIVATTLASRAGSQLRLVDAHVLIALADPDRPTDAIELSARSELSLDTVYQALHRLIGSGHVHEQRHRHTLTDDGHRLVATLERAQREGIESYLAQLLPDELQRLELALRSPDLSRTGHAIAPATKCASPIQRP
jgi:DNA-binding MarR family transcriptional regulator